MIVYIDGDACPVKDSIIQEARVRKIQVVIVTSFSHYSQKEVPENVKIIYVDEGADSADYRIVALLKKEDILVTQDYGLASLALGIGARILHHTGFEYTHENIGQMLESRHMGAVLRKSGQKTKGPKKFTLEDRKKFQQLFTQILNEKTGV